VGQHHFGELRLETAQAEAERIISEKPVRLGWQPAELAPRRKHDTAKLEIAARLRRETTLSVKQIATRLHLGTPKSASALFCTAKSVPEARAGGARYPSGSEQQDEESGLQMGPFCAKHKVWMFRCQTGSRRSLTPNRHGWTWGWACIPAARDPGHGGGGGGPFGAGVSARTGAPPHPGKLQRRRPRLRRSGGR